ncbi:MAG: dihydroorotate dehydrogenase electron transfer subunit [Nitrososphaerales archaeon]
MRKIQGVHEESQTMKTFEFVDVGCSNAAAGQFIMLWVPGVDEFPLSLSNIKPDSVSITVRPWAAGSHVLYEMGVGSLIGIRGPYGRGFERKGTSAALVGGGTGIAPLIPLAETLLSEDREVALVLAAKNRSELPFLDKATRLMDSKSGDLLVTTDDGSLGVKGAAPEALGKLLKQRKIDMIYTCGPEPMMQKVVQMSRENGIEIQASLERIMKCGIGLCGSCCIGDLVLCKDGPVISSTELMELEDELGLLTRDKSGKLLSL